MTTSPMLSSVFGRARQRAWSRRNGRASPKLAPSPPWIPLLGHLPPHRREVLRSMENAHRDLGAVVRFEYPIVTGHSFIAPDDIARIFVTDCATSL